MIDTLIRFFFLKGYAVLTGMTLVVLLFTAALVAGSIVFVVGSLNASITTPPPADLSITYFDMSALDEVRPAIERAR